MAKIVSLIPLALVLVCCEHEGPNPSNALDAKASTESPDALELPAAEGEPASGLLVNPFDWTALPQDAPPFARETPSPCSEEAYGPEDLTGVWVYSIDTELCDWLSVEQATALELKPGDKVRARVWHFELTAPIDAKARVGLALGQTVLVTAEKDIPSDSAMMTLEALIERPWSKGSPLIFHVDNHGANSWHLVEVELNPED